MRYSLTYFIIVFLLLWSNSLLAQAPIPSWENRDIIVSKGQVLVGSRESFRDGAAAFTKRVHHYLDTLTNDSVVPYAYESLHLEIQTDQPFGHKTIIDREGALKKESAYELIFYQGRFADPGFKRELGRVYLPIQSVKLVANGEQEQTHYYSIDLAKVPLLLLCDQRLARIDIHHVSPVTADQSELSSEN